MKYFCCVFIIVCLLDFVIFNFVGFVFLMRVGWGVPLKICNIYIDVLDC